MGFVGSFLFWIHPIFTILGVDTLLLLAHLDPIFFAVLVAHHQSKLPRSGLV